MALIGRAAAAEGEAVEAYAWFTLAAEFGVQISEKPALSNALNSAQLVQAAQRIEEIRAAALRGLTKSSLASETGMVETGNGVEGERPAAPSATAPDNSRPVPDTDADPQAARIAILEAELAAARAEARSARQSDEWAAKLEESLAQANKERDLLSSLVAALQSDEWTMRLEAALAQANTEREALAVEIATLRKNKQSAEESLAQLHAKPALDGKVNEQNIQIADLRADLAAARAELRDQARESGGQLEAALAQASKERVALSSEIAALRKDKQSAEESLAQMRAMPALDGQVETQKSQIAKLEADLAAARSETRAAGEESRKATALLEESLAKATQDQDARSAEIAALRQDRVRAEEARDKMRVELSAARSKLESDLATARAETGSAKAGSVEVTRKLEAALAQAMQEKEALTAQAVALRRDKQSAEESLAQLRQKPALDGQVNEQKAQIAKLESDLASAHTAAAAAKESEDRAARKSEAAVAQAETEKDALSEEIAALRRDKQRAEESLAQMRAKPSLDGQVEAQKARIAKLETDLVAAQTETRAAKEESGKAVTSREAALAKASQERDALSAEISTLRGDKQRAEELLAQMRARPSLEGKVESQQAQIARLETDLAAAQTETAALRQKAGETGKLEASLTKANQERDTFSGEIASLRRDKLSAEEARDQMRAELSDARSRLETYDASIRGGALVDATSLREALRQSEMKVDATARRLSDIEEEHERLQARMRAAEATAAAAEVADRNDSSEMERLRGELAEAEQARTAAIASREAAIRDLSAEQIRNDNLVRELARARPGALFASASPAVPRAAPSRAPAPETVDVPAPAAREARVHTVARGENLSVISLRYYNTPNRWPEIFEANRNVMQTENHLVPGMQLRIP